jgi:hypothetical protein
MLVIRSFKYIYLIKQESDGSLNRLTKKENLILKKRKVIAI